LQNLVTRAQADGKHVRHGNMPTQAWDMPPEQYGRNARLMPTASGLLIYFSVKAGWGSSFAQVRAVFSARVFRLSNGSPAETRLTETAASIGVPAL
jgi:hypothetical protein